MKTNKTNLKSRIFAVMVSVMLLATCFMSTTAFAEGGSAVENETVTFEKNLVMDKEAHVPNATFNFSIAAAEGNTQSPLPTITPSVSFSDTDTSGTKAGTPTNSQDTTKKYATKTVEVNFANVEWTAPGIYSYTITETGSVKGVTNDTNSIRTLDVRVVYDNNGNLHVDESGLHTGANKSTGFTNTYNTHNLTLTKNVEGNQGDRGYYFNFAVTLTAPAGTVFDVTLPVDANDHANTSEITVPEAGTITVNYKLKNGQSIVINGITDDATYTITETAVEGYITVNNKNEQDGNTTGTITINNDDSVTFTNTKNGNVPTGILLETAPYMILGAVVLAGIVVLFVTRRRRSH